MSVSSNEYRIFNIAGHSFKGVAYYFIYKMFCTIRSEIPILDFEKRQDESIRYKLLTEKAKDIILFVGLDGKILDANHAAVQAYGYTYQELTALTVYNLREPGSLPKNQLKQAQDEGIFFETVHIRKDGSCFPVEVSSSGVKIGEHKILMSVIRDISERKNAEKMLRESEERYRSLIMNLNECFVFSQIILDDEGKTIDFITLEANNAFFETVGLKREEIIGKSALESTPFLKNATPNIFELCGKVALTGEKANFEIYLKDIGVWTNFSSYSPAKGYFVGIFTDITAKKLLLQRLGENNKKLEETVKKLKLTQTQLIQNEKLAGIGQLAAGIAHEINNPLGFVMSNVETLEKYISKLKETIDGYRNAKACLEQKNVQDNYQAIRCITDVETDSKIDFIFEDFEDLYQDTYDGLGRISKIVTSLRNFSRGDQQNEFLEYDLNAGIKNTLIVAHNEIKYYAKVEERLGNIPSIFANGGQINQVLLNTIINGIQAIKAKQSTEPGSICIMTYYENQYVYCSIQDNGIGIPKESLNRIFEPFYTTKKVGEGTGLGLSISYDIIVNKHKGDITVDSTVGVGTKFTVKLPVKIDTVSEIMEEGKYEDTHG
ncbi:PAS domain S-box protein [Petroclostridium sp. X23]|uniref:PAS domain-containing sensor histidine kinase n=1 Tax=Petroclostridium sp. X23 TaxID=3045146 RepID=UPI0024AD967C|nr:PAS domain S-box protein [Petroclostridium sp. X23]WHH59012.1 PAS domain S-box protein [Petroclostridium sp. X23]